MNLNSKARLLLWLRFPKLSPALPFTALIALVVFSQANARLSARGHLPTAYKILSPGPEPAINILKIKGKVTDEKGLPLPG
ncbi:hypothetical protein G7074_15230 [Pedobacter sp. HDW13]|nr:hypothetical protein [Pedobacter sp. HDW13]QIL40496.1 hypothetical protein G7074_15230 [Pedobacter sp. HDW13]